MNLLNPLFLVGLAAAAIPLFIFLWNRNRKPEVVVSSLFLFRKIEQSSIRSVKITSILLLLLRMLIIGMLAVAFAQPFFAGEDSSDQVYDTILIDYGPELSHLSEKQFDGMIGWIENYTTRIPNVMLFSTDSLNRNRWSTSRQISWFRSVPSFEDEQRVLFITASGSSISSHPQIKNHTAINVIQYQTPGMEENAGIRSVRLPSGLWQTGAPNLVEIELDPEGISSGQTTMDVFLNDLLIQTIRIDFSRPLSTFQVPVSLSRVGWHQLKVVLNTGDFNADNIWVGGIYLPERVVVTDRSGSLGPSIQLQRLATSQNGGGQAIQISASAPDDGSSRIYVLSSSGNFPPSVQDPIIWIPDFSNPTGISSSLEKFSLAGAFKSGEGVSGIRYMSHSFNDYLNPDEREAIINWSQDGYVSISGTKGLESLIRDGAGKPVLSLLKIPRQQLLIFHVQPFSTGNLNPSWAVASLLRGILYLSSQSPADGFYQFPVHSGYEFSLPSVPAGSRFSFGTLEWPASTDSYRNGALNPAVITAPGLLSIRTGTTISGLVGFNFPPAKVVSSDNVTIWASDALFPLITQSQPIIFSTGIFLLILLLLILEVWIARGKTT